MKRHKEYEGICYGLFRRNKKTGELQGWIEESFSMDWSKTHVKAYVRTEYQDKEDIQKYLQRIVDEYRTKYPAWELFIVRIGSKSSPADVDLHTTPKGKFEYRNRLFTERK